jgi:glutamate racemase
MIDNISLVKDSQNNLQSPIGVFDSGIGGLTVVAKLTKYLPQESIIYLGDTARLPYGNKSKETVLKFTKQAIEFFLAKQVKMIIIACNTSSSLALPLLESNLELPIMGVINPGVEEAIKVTRTRKIGVIGTRATISSNAYQNLLKLKDSEIKVYAVSCPLFVPLVEEGWGEDEVAYRVASRYLKELKEKNIDTLILGCTHYPLLKDIIKRVIGEHVALIDSAKAVAYKAKSVMVNLGITNSIKHSPLYEFYVTDEPQQFKKIAKLFLDIEVENVKKAVIEEISYV